MTNGIGTSAGDAASVADGRTPLEKGNAMADLVAIGYPDEVTAEAAADEVRRPAGDLTTHHAVGGGAV